MNRKILFFFTIVYLITGCLYSQLNQIEKRIIGLSKVQQDLFIGISGHNIYKIENALRNGADINKINPLNGNSPLKDALVQYYKLLSEKFDWKVGISITGISTLAAIIFFTLGIFIIKDVKTYPKKSINRPLAESEEYRSYIFNNFLTAGATAALSIILVKYSLELRKKLKNAHEIIEIILKQPDLIIDREAIDFYKKYLLQKDLSLENIIYEKTNN